MCAGFHLQVNLCYDLCKVPLVMFAKICSCLINYKTAYMQPYTCSGIFHLCQREFVPVVPSLVLVTDVINVRMMHAWRGRDFIVPYTFLRLRKHLFSVLCTAHEILKSGVQRRYSFTSLKESPSASSACIRTYSSVLVKYLLWNIYKMAVKRINKVKTAFWSIGVADWRVCPPHRRTYI